MAQSIAPAYLQGLTSVSASNQATERRRVMEELARQRAEMEAQRQKENSFGNRMARVGSSLLPVAGMAAGAAFGGPVGGMIGGGLGSALGQAIGPPGTPNNAATAAMMGGSMGSYLQQRPGASVGMPNQGYLSDEEYRRMLLDQYGGGPI